jgi:hypothetical protein
MKMNLDAASQRFQDDLIERANLARKKKSLATVDGMAAAILEIKEALEEIQTLLQSSKPSAAHGPVNFVITERDQMGNIKSFRVD